MTVIGGTITIRLAYLQETKPRRTVCSEIRHVEGQSNLLKKLYYIRSNFSANAT